MQRDPDSTWMAGYVDWEWQRGRHMFESIAAVAGRPVKGARVLEFGCNVGATAIVLARIGARVTAADIDLEQVELARLNAARYGLERAIDFIPLTDSTSLPFEGERFDWVSCSSVLEYVEPRLFAGVTGELDRVLAPRGILVVMGTSNRLWPREVHSGDWFSNYVPRALDSLLGPHRRGISAWTIGAAFPGYENVLVKDRRLLVDWRRRRGDSPPKRAAASAGSLLLSPLGLSIGMLSRTVTLVLRKP